MQDKNTTRPLCHSAHSNRRLGLEELSSQGAICIHGRHELVAFYHTNESGRGEIKKIL
jgi:hypothetical protein